MIEELYNKIDKFCNETDWSKYPSYEHALEGFIKGIVAEETKKFEKENAELKETVIKMNDVITKTFGNLTKAKEIIRQFLNDYPVITKELLDKLEQFIKE